MELQFTKWSHCNFFLTISLLSNHDIKNRHINTTISKLGTNNTSSSSFKNTFQEFFSCSVKSRDSFLTKWSCVLRNGVNIFVPDIKFTVSISQQSLTQIKNIETISRILLRFFVMCKEITG